MMDVDDVVANAVNTEANLVVAMSHVSVVTMFRCDSVPMTIHYNGKIYICSI